MPRKFLAPLVLSSSASDPTGVGGALYYNTTSNSLKYYNGTSWAALGSATPNNGTLTLATSGTGLSGSATFTADQSGNTTFTVTLASSSTNTASSLVARDASGNFAMGTLTATGISAGASTFTGKVTLPAATTSAAALNIPSGTAPTSPADWDIWTETGGIKYKSPGITNPLTLVTNLIGTLAFLNTIGSGTASNISIGPSDNSKTTTLYGSLTTPNLVSGFLKTDASGVVSTTSSTGSGSVVLATSPTLTTPTLGVASATSINKVAITAPATSATLTIADGKTLTVSNTLTMTGTDSSSVAFGAGGTVQYVPGAWTSYTPDLYNSSGGSPTAGSTTGQATNAVKDGGYFQMGKIVFFRAFVSLGTNFSIGTAGGNIGITLPVTPVSSNQMVTAGIVVAGLYYRASAFTGNGGTSGLISRIRFRDGQSTANASASTTVPGTWAVGDYILVSGTYEAA